MFNKSLVSIYFTEEKIFAIQLFPNKKKVKISASMEIPEGVIDNFKVTQREKLTKFVADFWKNAGFKEKSVGIIVPEFSTFTKLLNLPKISISEIAEAVDWQVQEYLPENKENMITDWKIVEKKDKGFEVLVVSIPKNLLSDYVGVVEAVGLFPVSVSTPSLCLTKLIPGEKQGSLIVYAGVSESILVYCVGAKILGTSVLDTAEMSDLAETCRKMIDHYGRDKVEKILVSGVGITGEIIDSLKQKLKKNINILKVDLKDVKDDVIQEFLIPLSMQQGDTYEPIDARSVNLLPTGMVEKYKIAKMKVQAWSITLTITLFVWIPFLLVVTMYLMLSQQITSFKEENRGSIEMAQKRALIEKQVLEINEISKKVETIKEATVYPQELLNIITNAKPGGISINEYQMDLDKGEIRVAGISSDRSSLVAFSKNLEAQEKISLVEIPISSFESEVDLEFDATVYLEGVKKPMTKPVQVIK